MIHFFVQPQYISELDYYEIFGYIAKFELTNTSQKILILENLVLKT